MDPLSHATFGVTLVRALGVDEARAGIRVQGAIAATILGSLSPDIDAAVMPFGWDRYLRVHEIGTHTIVGTIVCGLLTAALVWVGPAATKRHGREVGRHNYRTLAVCAWIAAVSHVLLDLLSSARLKPGWPIVDTVVSLPVVAMADPWLLALCVLGAITVRFAINGRRGAVIVLALIAVFAIGKGMAGVLAVQSYAAVRDRLAEPVTARLIEARWASLSSWRVFDRTMERLRAWQVGASGSAELVLSWPLEPETPLVSASRRLTTVSNFLHSHELGFAVTVPGSSGPAAPVTVLWSDIRFCWDPDVPGAPVVEPIVDSPGHGRLACGVWFGGEMSASGQPVREFVRVGSFTQVR